MKFKTFRFAKVQSTNDTAIRILRNSNIHYGMVVSDMQSRGRGRYGKRWISTKGNLFVSFFYNLDGFKYSLSHLTKTNCLIVKKLLSIYYPKKIIFKKPNDLLIKKKKICGILQETVKKSLDKYLIVGIGVNLIKSPEIKNYPTTNLSHLINKEISKKMIILRLKNLFETELTRIKKK